MALPLSTLNHDRDIAGLKYVYPVISRRAGGLSIGINFNPNNACNWRCVYCQVPDLSLGGAPELDLELLSEELRFFLQQLVSGEFYTRYAVPESQRQVKDIAISGNGEPTSLLKFDQAVAAIIACAEKMGVLPEAKLVLISNGSLLHRREVQTGLGQMAKHNGELWFKLDSATSDGRALLNNSRLSQQKLLEHLRIASELCPTKLQTCMLHYREAWSPDEKTAYLGLLQELTRREIKIRQVMLYSIARQSHQPEAVALIAATLEEMETLAADIKALGYDVSVSI